MHSLRRSRAAMMDTRTVAGCLIMYLSCSNCSSASAISQHAPCWRAQQRPFFYNQLTADRSHLTHRCNPSANGLRAVRPRLKPQRPCLPRNRNACRQSNKRARDDAARGKQQSNSSNQGQLEEQAERSRLRDETPLRNCTSGLYLTLRIRLRLAENDRRHSENRRLLLQLLDITSVLMYTLEVNMWATPI
jgi:hypothetical protein